MDELPYYLGFNVFPGIGPVRFRLLLDYFGTAKKAWEASEHEMRETGLGEILTTQFIQFRKTFDVDAYQKKLTKKEIICIPQYSEEYPALLKTIADAPFILYVYGKDYSILSKESKTIGIVGTRNISPYGREVTRQLTQGLVSQGFVIVSGLARGVDTMAHQTTLEGIGRTVAVLGCGVDIIAPSSNTSLYYKIAECGGCIVSEMPLGHMPGKGLFPARNRIISGLSLGIVVTEGDEHSGSLITARYAGEQGREVFAVPGPITSVNSRGPAKLIKNGAVLVETYQDVLNELKVNTVVNVHTQKRNLSPEERRIIELLQTGQKHIDVIVRETSMTPQILFGILTNLEVKGVIVQMSDQVYTVG